MSGLLLAASLLLTRAAEPADSTLTPPPQVPVPLPLPDLEPAPATKAPPPEGAWMLSLQDAVSLGLRESQDIRISDSRARETRTQIDSARAGVLPNVGVQFSYQRTVSPNSISLPPGFDLPGLPFGQDNTYNAGVSLTQPLYRAGSFRAIRIARDYYESAVDQATETRLDTVLNICLAYYGAVLADRLAEIAQAQIDQFELELKDVRLRRQAGEASDLDVSRLEVDRANVEPQLVDALNAKDAAMLELKRLLTVAPEVPLELTDGLSANGFEPLDDEELQGIITASAQQRAAVRAAQRNVTIRRAEVRQARTAYLPNLDGVGNLGFQAYPHDTIPDQSDWQENWTVGVQLSWSLFDGGRRRASVQAAKERVEQSELQLDLLRQAIRTEVETWHLRLKRSEALIGTRSRASARADEVYGLIGLSYRNGSATYLELTQARNTLRSARANEVQTLHDYFQAYLHLIRTVGVAPESFSRVSSLEGHKAPAAGSAPPPPPSSTPRP